MGKVKQKASKDSSSMMRPALTPEAREDLPFGWGMFTQENHLEPDTGLI